MGAALKLPIAGDWADRAPRYTLRADDDQLLRFSRNGQMKKISKTQVLNISETGMAFQVDGRAVPHLGEIIKVELKLSGSETFMIRMGRVVRLESPDGKPHDIQVAVEFVGGQDHERQQLKTHLHQKFSEDLKSGELDGETGIFRQIIFYLVAAIGVALGFYL
jgi:hypothetical protein